MDSDVSRHATEKKKKMYIKWEKKGDTDPDDLEAMRMGWNWC